MSSKISIIFAIASTFLFLSCGGNDENVHTLNKTEFYNDFLWSKYTPQEIEMGKIVVEFDDDADSLDTSFRLGVFEFDEEGEKMPLKTSVAQIYFNDVEGDNNQIEVNQDMSEIKLKAVFKPGAENRMHNWSVEVLDEERNFEKLADENGDRIDSFCERFDLKKEKVWNPLAKWLFIVFITIAALNLFWLLILKPNKYPCFKNNRIDIVGPAPYMQTLNVKGKYVKIVLTKRSQAQGFFNKLYKGEIKYLVNPIWAEDIELLPRDKNSIRINVRLGGVFNTNLNYVNNQMGSEGKITNTVTKGITTIKIK